MRLFHLKYLNGWSSKNFTMLPQKDTFSESTALSSSSYEAKELIKKLDLAYEKIYIYPNDCLLDRDKNINQQSCNACGSS